MKYISIVFIVCSTLLFAQERTGTSFFVNAGLNYNMHSTDIKGFNGFENCCDKFTGGNYLDPTFGFGMELSLGKLLFDMPSSYVLQLNYNGLSSEYSEERFRGYKINEFDKEPIMVNHLLNPNIKLISLGNSIYSELFDGFSFGLGAEIGFVATSNFTQNEVALSPSDFTFSNGKREINTGEGDIEEMNSIIFSLFAGVRYDIYDFSDWTIRPELKYNYIPGSILDGKDLNVSQLSGSVSLVYHITEKSVTPPPPPMPEVKEPEIVEAPIPPSIHIELELKTVDGKIIKDNDVIKLPIDIYETRLEYALRPIVFFDSSDASYKKYSIESFTNSDFDVQTQMIKSIADKMNANEKLTVSLTTYDLGDEKATLPQARLDNMVAKLGEYGITPNRITQNIEKVNNDFKYDELKEEYRKVDFALSDNSQLIKSIYEINNKIEVIDMDFVPTTKVTTIAKEYDQEASLYIDDKLELTRNKDFNFSITSIYNNKLKKDGKLKVKYIANAQVSGIYDDEQIGFTLVTEPRNITSSINTTNNGSKITEQYILAYTEFDKSTFKSVDEEVLNIVRKALNNNLKVSIYASTDNLGDEVYNKALAERRAIATKALIGGNTKNLEIVYPQEYLFSNEHPYGRMLNRAIVIRIEK